MSGINLTTLADTQALATRLAAQVRVGDVITLAGDLGAGKTTFAQYFIQALNPVAEVTSPTFTLLQTYPVTLADGVACELFHYDLYRIEHESSLIELGFDDALAGVTLIEWPERLGVYKLPVSLAVSLTLADDGSRRATLRGDARWKDDAS